MKKIFSVLLILFVLSLTFSSAFASEPTNSYSTETAESDIDSDNDLNVNEITEENGEVYLGNGPNDSENFIVDGGVPIVTTEQASSWVEKKGYEIVNFLQVIIKPFAIIVFIVCGFLALLGAWGNSQLVSKGIFGMFFAIIMYVVVIFAPDILQFALQWTRS